jgi:hypothetical protein
MREARYVCNDIEKRSNDAQPWRKRSFITRLSFINGGANKKSGKVIGVFFLYANEKKLLTYGRKLHR